MRALILPALLSLATPAAAAPDREATVRAPQDQPAPARRTQRARPQSDPRCADCARQPSGRAQAMEAPVAGLLMIPAHFLPEVDG
jgi:hypothetical protein